MTSERVLLPYGFLLEDNHTIWNNISHAVLLPYGFLLEDNLQKSLIRSSKVWLPYGFLLEDNHAVHLKCHWKEAGGYES